MKKTRLLAILMLFVLAFCLCGCGEKGSDLDKIAHTPDSFMNVMVEQGYNIYDISAQLGGYEDIKTVYVATTGEELYQIEFYELSSFETAYALYVGNKIMFEEEKTAGAVDSHLELGNFARYTLLSGGKYMVVSLVDNTMIYAVADESFKADIDAALSALGY